MYSCMSVFIHTYIHIVYIHTIHTLIHVAVTLLYCNYITLCCHNVNTLADIGELSRHMGVTVAYIEFHV